MGTHALAFVAAENQGRLADNGTFLRREIAFFLCHIGFAALVYIAVFRKAGAGTMAVAGTAMETFALIGCIRV